MEDEEIKLCNLCTDLVGLERHEGFVSRVLESQRGEWLRVGDLCLQLGLAVGDVKPELFAAWLPDPLGADGYVVILFYDDDSKWSMAAHYHWQRLVNAARKASGAAVPAYPASPSARP